MTAYSVAEAANAFSALIDKVMAGEEVVITRDGAPVVELRLAAVKNQSRADMLAWLKARRQRRTAAALTSVEVLNLVYDDPDG